MKGLTNLLRREFLKKAGLGSVALASLPSRGLGRAPTSRARAGSQPSDDNGGTTNWIVAAIENALTVNGVQYRMLLEGHGSVASDGTLQGQGSFVEIDNGTPVPHTILASGTWLATSLTSINIIGTYGSLAAPGDRARRGSSGSRCSFRCDAQHSLLDPSIALRPTRTLSLCRARSLRLPRGSFFCHSGVQNQSWCLGSKLAGTISTRCPINLTSM